MRSISCKGLDKPWSVLTFGCWQIAPSGGWGDNCTPEDAEASVKAALEGGITAFDTAEGYGDGESERRLGKALGSQKNRINPAKIYPISAGNMKIKMASTTSEPPKTKSPRCRDL